MARLSRETRENIEASLYFAFVIVVCVLAVLMCAGRSDGAHCPNGFCNVQKQAVVQKVVKQQVVAQPVVAYPYPVQYFVGAELRQEAVIEHKLRAIVREEVRAALSQSDEPPGEIPVFSQKQSIVGAACAKCHGGEKPKGDIRLDVELNDETRSKVARAVLTDHMPLGPDGESKPLSDEVKTRLLLELFGSE